MNVRAGGTTAPAVLARARARLAPLDLGLMAGLVALALIPRLSNLLTVPRFTDEQLGVLYALRILRGELAPLVGVEPYQGSLHAYLVATALATLGPSPFVPRLVSVALGIATVGLTYLLGRSFGGRLAGLLAGGLLLTSAPHALVSSRVAWSSSITPFFTTLFLLALVPVVRRGSRAGLLLAGLLFGVALQTSPVVLALLPGAGLALALARPRLIRSRWLVLAALFAGLTSLNLVVYHLLPSTWQGGGDAPRRLLAEREAAAEGRSGPGAVVGNAGALLLGLPRVVASQVEPRRAWPAYLADPSFWIYAALLVAGLLWPLRQGNPLPLCLAGGYGLTLALAGGRYEPIFDGRLLMPLVPLVFAGFGSLVADLWGTLVGGGPRLAMGLASGALVLYPLLPLYGYQQTQATDGQIDVDLIQIATALQAVRRGDEPILLDESLAERTLPGQGDLLQSLRALLELRRLPYRVVPIDPRRLEAEAGGSRTVLVVLALPYDRALEERFRFIQTEEKPPGRYVAYRLERRS